MVGIPWYCKSTSFNINTFFHEKISFTFLIQQVSTSHSFETMSVGCRFWHMLRLSQLRLVRAILKLKKALIMFSKESGLNKLIKGLPVNFFTIAKRRQSTIALGSTTTCVFASDSFNKDAMTTDVAYGAITLLPT